MEALRRAFGEAAPEPGAPEGAKEAGAAAAVQTATVTAADFERALERG
jgi:hypothetical protein